jgi:glycosyltransferase involved in cell wall biosynthesis
MRTAITRKRIFILSFAPGFGGSEKSIATLIPYLAKEADLTVFVENDRHYLELASQNLVGVALVRTGKGNSVPARLKTVRLILTNLFLRRPDAILTNQYNSALVLAFVSFVFLPRKIPCSVYIRDFSFDRLNFILKRLPHARFIATTEAIFRCPRYVALGLAQHRCEVIPNCVELPADPERSEEPATEQFVVCCARLVPLKGIDRLLRAFQRVLDQVPGAMLQVVGEETDKGYADGLRNLVDELEIKEAVSFMAFATDIDWIFRRGSVFVVPSLSIQGGPESFSRIIIEAWAHCKPVVAFDVGGPHYIIDDGKNGFLVDEDDVATMAARITQLLTDSVLRRKMGRNGHEKVRREFCPEAVAPLLLNRILTRALP